MTLKEFLESFQTLEEIEAVVSLMGGTSYVSRTTSYYSFPYMRIPIVINEMDICVYVDAREDGLFLDSDRRRIIDCDLSNVTWGWAS